MSKDLASRPFVIVDLDPLLEAWCRLELKIPTDQKEIKLNRKHDLGKLINSNRTSTNFRVKIPDKKNPVLFVLPVTNVNHHSLLYSFHYVTADQQQKIQDGIYYEFKKWCYEMFKEGYRQKHTQKEIVDAMLVGLNVRKTVANFDALKKFDYRNQRNESKRTFKTLLSLI